MQPITLFSWGYYGWGNHTPKLMEAVDAVESSRGFAPPIFVDIRIRRAVRAVGFSGSAFEQLIGSKRHRWMKSLGNMAVITQTDPPIQIADPAAANELLDLAIESAQHQQRVIYFCSCEFPRENGEDYCHRTAVKKLVLDLAHQREVPVQIVEWPGGDPLEIELELSPKDFSLARRGRLTIPLGDPPDLARVAGLPWGSVVRLHSGDETLLRVVGPATWTSEGWVLTARREDGALEGSAVTLQDYQARGRRYREYMGLA